MSLVFKTLFAVLSFQLCTGTHFGFCGRSKLILMSIDAPLTALKMLFELIHTVMHYLTNKFDVVITIHNTLTLFFR